MSADILTAYHKAKRDPGYIFAALICLLFIMTRYFFADFHENEWAYTVGPIRMAIPSFLSADPFIGGITSTFLLYNTLASPFYHVFGYLQATLICRVLIWIFQIWALARLARTLGITWWGLIMLFVVWLNVEQSLVAGEWIIKIASPKPVSYGFVFLALDSLLRRKLLRSGVYSGLAISFHVAVGMWSAVALICTVVITRKEYVSIKELLSFVTAIVLLSLPGLIAPLTNVLSGFSTAGTGASASEVARISVLLANPFHLDPDYFITGLEYLKVIVFFFLTLFLLNKFVEKQKAGIMIAFIACLFFIFGIGLVARRLEWYSFLQYYPFRVFDALLPLIFWIGFVLLFQRVFFTIKKNRLLLFLLVPVVIGVSNYLIDMCEPTPRHGNSLKSFTTALLRTEPRLTAFHLKERVKEWGEVLFSTKREDAFICNDLKQIELWIKENTPRNSIFITVPWDYAFYSFSLKAERSEFVSFKYVPPDKNILIWKERMEALNKGQFHEAGFNMLKELKQNYPKLNEYDLHTIKQRYGADYFVTLSEVRLNLPLVHENDSYRLYKL